MAIININDQKTENRGWFLIILSLLYLLYILFLWIFMLGSQQSFSFIGFAPPDRYNLPIIYTYIINFFILYAPFVSIIAILRLKRFGVYTLILSFLANLQTEIWSWDWNSIVFEINYQLRQTYNTTNWISRDVVVSYQIFNIFVSYLVPIVFWLLYFYAIKRKWSLFQ